MEACVKTIENLNLLFGDSDGEKHARNTDGLPCQPHMNAPLPKSAW